MNLVRPSSSDVWVRCPYSVYLTKEILNMGIDLSPSRYVIETARRGTELHEIAASILTMGSPGYTDDDTTNKYLDYARTLKNPKFEELIRLPKYGIRGTIDCLNLTEDKLEIVDLKTGRTYVSCSSYQLMCYMFLVMNTLKIPKDIEYVTTIVQNNEVRSLSLSYNFIFDCFNNIQKALKEISEGSKQYQAGDHCKYCKVKNYCSYYRNYYLSS